MPEVTEGQLIFAFPEGWNAICYDDVGGFYKTVVERSPLDFKAVDIIASSNDAQHIWIEVKDCAGNESANRLRFSGQDPNELVESKAWLEQQGWKSQVVAKRAKPYLPDEVAQKVVDTLTGLVTSIRHDNTTLLPFHSVLNNQKLDIVLFLTLNDTPRDYKRLASRLAQAIRARLHFLNVNQVTVCNEQTMPSDTIWSVTRKLTSVENSSTA